MIIVTLLNKIEKIKYLLNDNPEAKWCYIGKEVAKREKIANIFGLERRFYLKERLHKIAEKLRQPYLDFVAALGERQEDQLNWWASRFASKSNFQTDFFLLLCYKALVIELVQEMASKEGLVIFIEDPWLFVDLQNVNNSVTRQKNVKFLGYSNIFLNKFFYFTKGVIYRFLLTGWFVMAKLLMRYYHNGRKPKALEIKNSAVCILNPAEMRAFKDGLYVNNYMPGLTKLYERNGIPHFHLYPLPFPLSTARYVGRNKEILWPLINDAKFSSLAKRIFKYWKPSLNHNVLDDINGYQISLLLERERWFEFSSVGFNLQLILLDALNYFFRKKWCNTIIYIFENQPWEKMLCMSAQRNDIKSFGYQHSSIWKFFLSQFAGKRESSFMPLPHKIITAGSYFAQLYKEGGIPEEKIAVGGAWRYSPLLNNVQNNGFLKRDNNSKIVIIVSLPIYISISKSMLKNISNMISNNHLNKGVELWLKPHTASSVSKLNILNDFPCEYRVVNEPFYELLKCVDIVISSASTSGLEAFLYGKKVIFYVPENFIPTGALFDIKEKGIYKWYEGEEFDINFLKKHLSISENIEEIKRKYFDEINEETWLKFISI